MILSPDAKKFSIAREIQRTIIQPYLTHGTFSFCFILLTYNTSRIINKKLGLFKRPPLIHGIAYLGLLPTMILSYVVVKAAFNRYIDREVDRRAAQISPEYAAGGVEYYEKVMQRNIALRELGGRGQVPVHWEGGHQGVRVQVQGHLQAGPAQQEVGVPPEEQRVYRPVCCSRVMDTGGCGGGHRTFLNILTQGCQRMHATL